MWIDPFWVNVGTTILIEISIIILLATKPSGGINMKKYYLWVIYTKNNHHFTITLAVNSLPKIKRCLHLKDLKTGAILMINKKDIDAAIVSEIDAGIEG